MAQMTVRQIDDRRYEQLKTRARLKGVSVEALARDAIHEIAELTPEEKRALVQRMHQAGERAKVSGVAQTAGWQLVREDRDGDH